MITNVEQIKQAIQSLSKDEYSELVKWFYDLENREIGEKLNSLNQEYQSLVEELARIENTPLEQWRRFPQKVAGRWEEPLSHLESFIHYSSSIGRIYARSALHSLGNAPKIRSTSPEERARQLIVALLDLHTKDCSIAGAILSNLRSGYPNAGWILCRVMLESHIVSQFLVKYNHEDAAERYNGSLSLQFMQDHFPSGAKELYEEYISIFPDAKDRDYGWASRIGGTKRWTLRDMAKAVGSEDLYISIYKAESKYSHLDPGAYFGDIDEGMIALAWEALSEINSNKLYGQTDGPSIVCVAYEVAQYLSSSTLALMNVWPFEDKELLEEGFSHRSETVLDLLEEATHQSPFVRKVLGIQD